MKTYRIPFGRAQAALFLMLCRIMGVWRAERTYAWMIEHGFGREIK